MDLPGDTTGARIQADQSFEDGVELLVVGLFKMHTVQLAPDLLGIDHDGVEAVESLAPVFAKSPLEPSIPASVLSEHARRLTDKVSSDAWGDLVQGLVQRRNCQFHSLLKAQALLHDPLHAGRHRVEDVVIEARRASS